MPLLIQQKIAKNEIKKAQAKWKNLSPEQQASAQIDSNRQIAPGIKNTGEYYKVVVRPNSKFTSFRVQDVGYTDCLKRLTGKRKNGSWVIQAWLVNKKVAHIEGKRLIPDSNATKEIV